MKFKKGTFSSNIEGLIRKIIDELEKELNKNPEDKEILYKLGISYIRIGNTDKARDIYKRLKVIDPPTAQDLLERVYDI